MTPRQRDDGSRPPGDSLAHAQTELASTPDEAEQRFVDGVFSSGRPAAEATPTPFETGPTVAAPTALPDPVMEVPLQGGSMQPAAPSSAGQLAPAAPSSAGQLAPATAASPEPSWSISRRTMLVWLTITGALVLVVAVVAGVVIAWAGFGGSAGSDGPLFGAPETSPTAPVRLEKLTASELRGRLVRLGWTIDARASQVHEHQGTLLAQYTARDHAGGQVMVLLHRYGDPQMTDRVAQSFPRAAHMAKRRDGATLLVVIDMQAKAGKVESLADQLAR